MRCRVVVTGLGVVSPLGSGLDKFWRSLCEGRSAAGPITLSDASEFSVRIAAEVTDFDLPVEVDRRRERRLDRYAQFGIGAALEAWDDAGISDHDAYSTGLVIGSSHGGETSSIEATGQGSKPVSPFLIPRMLNNMAAAQIAMLLGLKGTSFAVATACATGAHAVGEAMEVIRRGDAKVMLAGAAEACITPLTLVGDDALGALSKRNDDPAKACRPFDRMRDGFVLGEGAAVLVLEDMEHAIARKAQVYAEVTGYGATTDATHETHPDPSGEPAARAIGRALEKARVKPSELSAIFAHATGTQLGDAAELKALGAALGAAAGGIPVTAIKGSTGHMLGASGAAQAVAAVKSIDSQIVPPTLNCDDLTDMPIDCVRGEPRSCRILHVLSNSFGFGGHNACIIFSHPGAMTS